MLGRPCMYVAIERSYASLPTRDRLVPYSDLDDAKLHVFGRDYYQAARTGNLSLLPATMDIRTHLPSTPHAETGTSIPTTVVQFSAHVANASA